MNWNWQKPDWPNFAYNSAALEPLEKRFLLRSGEFIGAFKHIGAADQDTLKIELIGDEAVKRGWRVAPGPDSGKRVLVVTPVDSADATKAEHHVVFVQNFLDELRRKVPLGK